MRINKIVIGIAISSFTLFGNEYRGYEENHSFSEPIETVQNLLDVRKDFGAVKSLSSRDKNILSQNFQKIKDITNFDASKVKVSTLQCTYQNEVTGNTIRSFFKKNKNNWVLQKVLDKKNVTYTRVKQKQYNMYDSAYCVDGFRVNFESKYPNSRLILIGRESLVEGIIVKKKEKTYISSFNLSHYPLNRYAQSGWFISKINLTPIKHRKTVNRNVPPKHIGFELNRVVPYMPNVELVSVPNEKGLKLVRKKAKPEPQAQQKVKKKRVQQANNGVTKLKKLVCDQKENYIRLVFHLNKSEPIATKIAMNSKDTYKFKTFDIDGKNTEIKKGNCSFLLTHHKNKKFSIDLKNFKYDITGLQYMNTDNPQTSYIDFFYEKSFFGNLLQ